MAEAAGLLRRPDDRYANVAAADVTESAANTLTFGDIDFGIGLGAGVGLLIDQIDYYVPPDVLGAALAATQDALMFGLAMRNDLTDVTNEFNNRTVIHMGTAQIVFVTSGGMWIQQPIVSKFTPPLIIATNRGHLYPFIQGNGATAAGRIQMRLYFRYIPLQASEYLELAEAFNLMG